MPDDEEQTIYVWLDALTNYLTVCGLTDTTSEADMEIIRQNVANFVHFVGKDIAKFHCIYWPSFLQAAFGRPDVMPGRVVNHGHWLKDNLKMSKSIGNIVEPYPLLSKFGVDSVRLFFLSQGPLTKDMDFNFENLLKTHNGLVIDSYLNMVQRILSKKIAKALNYSRPIQRPSSLT